MAIALAVLLSAALLFVASAVLHMALPWHKNDSAKLANEDAVLEALLRPLALPPGDYMVPQPPHGHGLDSAAFVEKMKRGPVAVFTILPNGPWAMGRSLGLWFVYCLVISAFAALVAVNAVAVGWDLHALFHSAALAAFLGYAAGLWQMSIWYRRSWRTTGKATLDGVVYALITAAVFAWLWPH